MFPALSDKTLALSEKVAHATMGIDALYRQETGAESDREGLVVVQMAEVSPTPFASYGEAQEYLADLAQQALALPEPDRRLYYTQACTSLWSFCAWRQGKLERMSDQISLFLHADPAPATSAQLDGYYRQLHRLLTEMGYTGDIKAQIAAWEAKNLVPADEVQDTMNTMMVQARDMCGRILPLPENDYYHCETVRGVSYNASSDFAHRRVLINIDPILTKQKLKHLVCHEVYPGHFMQFTLRRQAWEQGVGGLDGVLSVCNHSSSCTVEGIADAGISFLGWEEGLDDRANDLVSLIQAARGSAASYRLHTLGWESSRVEDFLRDNAPGGGEGWVANRIKFIQDPARAALIFSYWRGDEGVFPVWNRVAPEDRARFFGYIYGRLHTVQSLQLFS